MHRQPQQDVRHARRFRIKTFLLNLLFPVRIAICLVLVVLSYNYWTDVEMEDAKQENREHQTYGNKVSIVLFALAILLVNISGWMGVLTRNWSLAVAFNAVSIILIMIDLYCSIFDLPLHIIALVLTVIILILNILLSVDLNSIQKQYEMIRRARIEEAERKKIQQQLELQLKQYNQIQQEQAEKQLLDSQ